MIPRSLTVLLLGLIAVSTPAHAAHTKVCLPLKAVADADGATQGDQDAFAQCTKNAHLMLRQQIANNPQLFSAEAMVNNFINGTKAWAPRIITLAIWLFWSLAIIEFILTFGMLALNGKGIEEFAVELVKRVLILSFGLYLLSGHAILYDVLGFFRDTASITRTGGAGNEYSISDLLLVPLNVILNMVKAIDSLSFVSDAPQILMILVAAVLVLWALTIACLQLALVICELYIVLAIGLLSLGFFSLQLTREYPMRFFGGLIGTGFKLLALELIIALGLTMANSWTQMPVMHQVGPYMLMAGAALMYKEIAVHIPNYIQSLLTASPGSGVSAQSAVTAAGAVAAAPALSAARSAAAGGLAIQSAHQVARAGGATTFGEMARAMSKTIAGAAGGTMAERVRGTRGISQHINKTFQTVQATQPVSDVGKGAGKKT